MTYKRIAIASVLLPLIVALFFFGILAHAQTADQVQSQIDQHNQEIGALQSEIDHFQEQLNALGKQKNTLQSTINTLTIEQKQLLAQIAQTQNKIDSATLEITQLTLSIGDKQTQIGSQETAIAKALNEIDQGEQNSFVLQLFASSNLSEVWAKYDSAQQFNRALDQNIANLTSAKIQLSNNRDTVAATKQSLLALRTQLATQKRSIDANKATEQSLLAQTRNQESNYQKLIVEKQAAQKSFENELVALQGQLNLIVHPNSLPPVGAGVLRWPFSLAYMSGCAHRQSVFGNLYCITQYFGNTAFSTANPQIYSGHGHDGLDVSAPIGTPVLAARSGLVVGTGNTDAVAGCYSFGKWVMVQHGNGLNTMYAHLSVIEASKGQTISEGQEIGLSGMTGYATGPHLHFGVYATEGTKIMDFGQWTGRSATPCTKYGVVIPVATLTAYLNPLSYL